MRFSIFAILAVFTFSFIACNNDLNLISPKKDIPVVYGLLTPADTFQFIRVERAFIDESISALEIAQNPDSLYYPNLDVKIVSADGEFTFEKVDGNDVGYPREDGVFATSPNTLYRAKTEDLKFKVDQEYTLQINRGDNFPLVEAKTILLDEPRILRPTSTASIDFDYVDKYRILWRQSTAGLFDIRMHLNIIEQNEGNNSSNENKTLTWSVARNVEGEEFEQTGLSFYTFLQNSLEEDEKITRIFRNIDLEIVGGGEELLNYIKIGQANLGITSSQEIPTYTNLSEGFGIFSSKAKVLREGISISKPTLDSLRFGQYTKSLNFR